MLEDIAGYSEQKVVHIFFFHFVLSQNSKLLHWNLTNMIEECIIQTLSSYHGNEIENEII